MHEGEPEGQEHKSGDKTAGATAEASAAFQVGPGGGRVVEPNLCLE